MDILKQYPNKAMGELLEGLGAKMQAEMAEMKNILDREEEHRQKALMQQKAAQEAAHMQKVNAFLKKEQTSK